MSQLWNFESKKYPSGFDMPISFVLMLGRYQKKQQTTKITTSDGDQFKVPSGWNNISSNYGFSKNIYLGDGLFGDGWSKKNTKMSHQKKWDPYYWLVYDGILIST